MSAFRVGGAVGLRVRRTIVVGFLLASVGGTAWAQGERDRPGPDDLRQAAAGWARRTGPERQVVDQVCLVRGLPEFLEAIGTWDESHYFPILIDDVELTFKFLRAFGPARIVRMPTKADAVPENKLANKAGNADADARAAGDAAKDGRWEAAVAAVGRAWTSADAGKETPKGDALSKGPTDAPPGVVLSAPDSGALAGAVALAAGRVQPLTKLEIDKHHGDVLKLEEARTFTRAVERRIAQLFPHYDRLGDDCDFITLAGDWPYRYETPKGDNALDDLLGRYPDQRRWAFAGRLTGDLKASVYRAMCSLFLQPKSVLLFNSYDERDRPWSEYRMDEAAEGLRGLGEVTHRSGERASLTGWHESFDPVNRFGLLLVNTHGNPSQFNVRGGTGQSADIPPSVPSAVLMIHSFSAADPDDPDTIAGRWLAQGAFLYYGSMNEPFLQAFRTPGRVGAYAAERIPLAAAVRQLPPEKFGTPWRLMYLGDPLYRLDPRPRLRLARWAPTAGWPAYVEYEAPAQDTPADDRLNWALKTAIFRLQTGVRPRVSADPAVVLLGIERRQLTGDLPALYDALLADALLEANQPGRLLERFAAIPPAERSPLVQRLWETMVMNRLQRAVARRNFKVAAEVWSEAIVGAAPDDFHQQATARVAGLTDSRAVLTDWRQRLRKAAGAVSAKSAAARIVADELKRVDEKLAPPSTVR